MLEDTACVDDEFVIYTVDHVTVWFNRDDGDDSDEARLLGVRCARTRCQRPVFIDGVGFTNVW